MLVRLVRWTGWALVAAGVLIGLYLVYLLGWTNVTAGAAQDRMAQAWQQQVGPLPTALPGEPASSGSGPTTAPSPAPAPDPGSAVAAMWFEDGGTGQRILHDQPLYVVEGVSLADLERGPGHYPDTALPGGAGNFAVAGHRTTYGAPFSDLDRLAAGDLVHVVGQDGVEHVYEVAGTRVVAPTATGVVGPNPLDSPRPTLTLTTCHPRYSAAQRLVVHALLVSDGS